MRHPLPTLLLLLFILSLNIVQARSDSHNVIYQWFDKSKTFFSDRPHADAKILKISNKQAPYRVKRVIDGDTLLLENGVKVRLLGINTPEIAHRQQAAEAGGKQAKQWLTTQLKGQQVRLETDTEPTDKYNRTLAHVFTETGEHINVQLVQRGLATVSLYPPNLKYADALITAQHLAETQRLGLWNDPAYAIKSIEELDPDFTGGWQRLTGKVRSIRQTRRYYYLDFSENFSARMHRSNIGLFPNLTTYIGKTVEIRGKLNQQQGKLSMLIRYPDALRAYE